MLWVGPCGEAAWKKGGAGWNKKRKQKEEETRGRYCRNGHGERWVGGVVERQAV